MTIDPCADTWAWAGADPAAVTRVARSVTPAPDGGSLVRSVHDRRQAAGGRTARDQHDRSWAGDLDDPGDVLGRA